MLNVNVQGRDPDLDIATPGEVWPNGGAHYYPASVAACTIVSTNINDTGAGTGARTAKVHGINSSLASIVETVTLNGTTTVNLTNQFLRVNLIEILTAGSGDDPAGVITVNDAGGILSLVEIGVNRSRSAIFTPYNNLKNWEITYLFGTILDAAVGSVRFALLTRKVGEVWQARFLLACHGTGQPFSSVILESKISIVPGEDVRLFATTTVDNVVISGGFDLRGSSSAL